MKTLARFVVGCLLLPMLGGCAILRGDPVVVEYASGVTPGGVAWWDTRTGEGPTVDEGDTVTVDYEVRLQDGTLVDSTYERGLPLTFILGWDVEPIAGLQEGVRGMRPGGGRSLSVPPALAFGAQGVPGRVPPNSVLEFDVELISDER